MSKISLEDFETQMEPIVAEATLLNKRLDECRNAFFKLANTIEVDEGDDDAVDEFRERMFEYAENFIDNIDHEHSEVEPGNVDIWQSSTC